MEAGDGGAPLAAQHSSVLIQQQGIDFPHLGYHCTEGDDRTAGGNVKDAAHSMEEEGRQGRRTTFSAGKPTAAETESTGAEAGAGAGIQQQRQRDANTHERKDNRHTNKHAAYDERTAGGNVEDGAHSMEEEGRKERSTSLATWKPTAADDKFACVHAEPDSRVGAQAYARR